MIQSYFGAWSRPFDFKGKSNRKEYWSFNLISVFLYGHFNLLLYLLDYRRFPLVRNFLYLLIFGYLWTCIPLTVRRIRDIGMSWKWIFFALIPYAGNVFALIFLSRPSLISIGEKEYYLKYPTKKRDIWLLMIGAFSFFAIILGVALLVLW